MDGVPRDLAAPDQAAAFQGRDPDRVSGLAGDVGGRGARDVRVLARVRYGVFYVFDARRLPVLAHAVFTIAFARGRRVAVQRVRGGVVDLQRMAVVDDLRVAFFSLQLEAHATVLGDPQPARCARDERARRQFSRAG